MLTPDQRRDKVSQSCLLFWQASTLKLAYDFDKVKYKLSVGVQIATTNNTIITQLLTRSFAALMLLELTWVKSAY